MRRTPQHHGRETHRRRLNLRSWRCRQELGVFSELHSSRFLRLQCVLTVAAAAELRSSPFLRLQCALAAAAAADWIDCGVLGRLDLMDQARVLRDAPVQFTQAHPWNEEAAIP